MRSLPYAIKVFSASLALLIELLVDLGGLSS
jgi:hypothetical protein